MTAPAPIVILNGAPRSGKSSIAAALQEADDRPWLNLGVDAWAKITPPHLMPGIGLRPGGERPDLEAHVPVLFAALYEAIAAASRLGLAVVADVGHHDDYARPLGILSDCARRLAGLPVLFVGVRCPLDVIMARRNASGDGYAKATAAAPVPAPVARWQTAVHDPGVYDLDVDTSKLSAAECAALILARLAEPVTGPTAFERLAARRTDL